MGGEGQTVVQTKKIFFLSQFTARQRSLSSKSRHGHAEEKYDRGKSFVMFILLEMSTFDLLRSKQTEI